MSDEKKAQLESMYSSAKRSFPNVPDISADELMQRLSEGEELVLVDVRQPHEQEVSMLPGAITVQDFQESAEAYAGKTIVPYWTIGGRSGKFGQQLLAHGFEVLNFAGSILAWSLAGGELQKDGETTNKVFVNARKYALVHEDHEAVW